MRTHVVSSDWYATQHGRNRVAAWVQREHIKQWPANRAVCISALANGDDPFARQTFVNFLENLLPRSESNLVNLLQYAYDDYGRNEVQGFLFTMAFRLIPKEASVKKKEEAVEDKAEKVPLESVIKKTGRSRAKRYQKPKVYSSTKTAEGRRVRVVVQVVVTKTGQSYVRAYAPKLKKYVKTSPYMRKKYGIKRRK